MNKSSPKFGIILLFALNLVALIVWGVLLFRARAASATYALENQELSAENSKETYLSAASKDLRATEKDRQYLSGIFVEEGAEVNFLERIESLGKHSGVEIKVDDFGQRENKLRLLISTKGSFTNSYYFLRLVETLPLAISVDSVSLASTKGDKGKVTWQGHYEISLGSYLLKEPAKQ